MGGRVVQKGDGAAAIRALAENARGWNVAVGVLGGSHGDISMPELAVIQEFGAPAAGIPERSFMREGMRRAEPKIRKMLRTLPIRKLLSRIDGGFTIRLKLAEIGRLAAGEMRGVFDANSWPRNAPATIAKKGFDRPLVDEDLLKESPDFKVYKDIV